MKPNVRSGPADLWDEMAILGIGLAAGALVLASWGGPGGRPLSLAGWILGWLPLGMAGLVAAHLRARRALRHRRLGSAALWGALGVLLAAIVVGAAGALQLGWHGGPPGDVPTGGLDLPGPRPLGAVRYLPWIAMLASAALGAALGWTAGTAGRRLWASRRRAARPSPD